MRPSLNETMMGIAHLLARRATCQKLAVGCVLVNYYGHIVGTGWNGVARGLQHCTDKACPGVGSEPGSDRCEAIHAETNALLQCKDVHSIARAFVTHAPCMRCVKELLNTSCSIIIFEKGSSEQPQASDLWKRAGRGWMQYGKDIS